MRVATLFISLSLIPLGATLAGAEQLDAVRARGTLICGTLGLFEPNSFQDPKSGKLVGYDIDICDEIAARLGVKPEYKIIAVAARVPELAQNRVDVLTANFTYTPDRAQQVDFSDTYFVASENIAVARSSGIKALDELNGKRIATTEGSTSADYAKAAIPGAQIITFKDGPTAFLAFQQNKAEGYAVNILSLRRYQEQVETSSNPIDILPQSTFDAPFGVGVAKDSPALKAEVNKVLHDLEASGKLDEIWDRWVGKDSNYGLKRTFKVAPVSGH
ncbi:transporter substrate-binding domain-containing protein [Mesorhizobium sp. DCY119]|uniref:transporter substrate-binding domain-containing protein n=1 Tax=Mesorhizobium sp. DCY119 TaxID=2108445 RepID=UPI000E724179|nr:transporter substrate-binding domain-containing protein [Mesorhizobium sp. DCY119]RJG40529.1 cysteine ABC transporter substrate-binding protein [Mesorhizobium sp. DCY119]